MIENGTKVRVLGTFGQKWLEAEYGNERGELVGDMIEQIDNGICLVKLESENQVYMLHVLERELEVLDV